MSLRSTLVRLAAAIALASGGVVVINAAPAMACIPNPVTGQCVTPKTYYVEGTSGTLAVQSVPAVGHVTKWLNEGAAVQVICQVNNGSDDPYDSIYDTHTWDAIAGGGWVFDHYISTPAQNAYGWSPGVPNCGGIGQPLTVEPAVTAAAAGLKPGDPNHDIVVYHGPTATGPIFEDSQDYWNEAAVLSGPGNGVCQELVLANSDFFWLDFSSTLNDVFTWKGETQAYGHDGWSNSANPQVGDIVVFNGGHWTYNTAGNYWDYGTGHVALVVAATSSSFTVAEFNFHLGGGGTGIIDLRAIPWPGPNSQMRNSVAAFLR